MDSIDKEKEYEEKIKDLLDKIESLEKTYPKALPSYFLPSTRHLIDIIPFIDIPDNDEFYMRDIVTGYESAYLTNAKELNKDQHYEQLSFDQDCQTIKQKKTRSKYRENEYYKYKIYPSNTGVEIVKLQNHQLSDVTIPASLEGIPVVSIGKSAFEGAEVESVHFPETIKTIGDRAFWGCKHLRKVSFPDALDIIGEECFSESGIVEVSINVAAIPVRCFNNCYDLTRAELGEKTEVISAEAFANTHLTEIVIPAKVRMIGYDAFSLVSKEKANDISHISSMAFLGNGTNINSRGIIRNYDLIIYCHPGSICQKWARSNGVSVRPVNDFFADKEISDIF